VISSELRRALQSATGPGAGPGALTLVGVGPGDPELLTVAAVRAIALADTVAYPVARLEAAGMAAGIAAVWMAPEQRRLPLLFPMVEEAAPRLSAWGASADALAAEVAEQRAVVLLCEGDASLYASCSYALLALARRHPACPVRVVPGISAMSAAAAAASSQGLPWPLVLQQESLLIRCSSVPLRKAPCWPCTSSAGAGCGCNRCSSSGACWRTACLPGGWVGLIRCWLRPPRCRWRSSPTFRCC
jgi:precorrin-2 C(20)-methyltransferase